MPSLKQRATRPINMLELMKAIEKLRGMAFQWIGQFVSGSGSLFPSLYVMHTNSPTGVCSVVV